MLNIILYSLFLSAVPNKLDTTNKIDATNKLDTLNKLDIPNKVNISNIVENVGFCCIDNPNKPMSPLEMAN